MKNNVPKISNANKENTTAIVTIIQVCAGLDTQGGVERGTVEMSRYIVKQKWQSLVASSGGAQVGKLVEHGAKHFQLSLSSKNPFTIIANGWRLARIIKKYNVDIIQARSRAPAWSAIIAAKLTKIPLITSFHGTYGLKPAIKKYYNASMVKGQKIIANSDFIKAHIIKNYGIKPNKIAVAHRGFDIDYFNPDNINPQDIINIKKLWGINDGNPVIMLPGRITRWKGQHIFLEALENLKDLEWHAIIVGGAEKKQRYLKELEKTAGRMGLVDKIHFVGKQSNMPLIYSVADIVVSASTEPEAFGRVAVEAQAMGKPIVTTAHGGSLETVRDNETGFLVVPNNIADMAKILRILLEDLDNCKAMGDNGKKWMHNNFTVENMCAKEFAVYKEILGVS